MSNFANATNSRIATEETSTTVNPLEKNLWKLVVISALTYLIWSDKVSVNFIYGENPSTEYQYSEGKKVKAGLFTTKEKINKRQKQTVKVELPASALNNVTAAMDPDFANRNGIPHTEMEARLSNCREYVKRFAPIAVAEMRKYGIPASITLAQGLLESNAGDSKLARTTNNHFGMKCFSKKCKNGHCANFTDDTHKDFFLKFKNTWGSFRAHSQFLQNSPRYSNLFELDKKDYQGWAKGLSKSGYATDKRYADKLIAIIQSLGLDRYDRLAN